MQGHGKYQGKVSGLIVDSLSLASNLKYPTRSQQSNESGSERAFGSVRSEQRGVSSVTALDRRKGPWGTSGGWERKKEKVAKAKLYTHGKEAIDLNGKLRCRSRRGETL